MKANFFLLLLLVGTNLCLLAEDYPIFSSGIYVGVRGSRLAWTAGDTKFMGYLIGPSCGIDYRHADNVYIGYRFYYMYGSSFSGSCKRDTELMNMQARLGYTFGKTLLFTPYFGFGIDVANFKRNGVPQVCKHLAYTNMNVPVGALLTYHPSTSFSIGLDYQYTPEVNAYARIAGFTSIRFDLKEKQEHSVELPMQFYYPHPRWKNVQYRLIPFYRTYYYGRGKLLCNCTCESSPMISISSQRAYEWGIRYEVAIW
ncbi:MAG: porin family protein [Chlamydiae bacterium]|nr:porin family protein [Chlamydiota bacterium]